MDAAYARHAPRARYSRGVMGIDGRGKAPTPLGLLERLRAGEIDLDRYLDLKVEEATTHLRALQPHEIAAIRRALRSRLATDPTLVELVREVTRGARGRKS
jgi:hypothetical protein